MRKLAHCAGGEINPITAMFGGVVGQEVMKAMSGKVRGELGECRGGALSKGTQGNSPVG